MKHLPGNPYDPHEAGSVQGPIPFNEHIEQSISDMGLTDATLIAYHIERLTHAVMALAYEQRTANLIAFDILHEAEPRLRKDKP